MVPLGAVQRRDGRYRGLRISIQRAAYRSRNSVGGEGPKALTADSTG